MSLLPGDYVHFKARVPLRRVTVGAKQWRYYDYGPRQVPPLVCLPGVAGTADVFYKQIMFLATRGYRVIAADAPPIWSHQEWLVSFEKFLDSIDIHHVHLYGTELGGFLAQLFANYRPRRVKSLVLSNTFLDTQYFVAKTPWSTLINWTPSFMLKRYVLTGIPNQPLDPFIADAVDFVVNQLETLEREELASRLILKTKPAAIGRILLPDSAVTIMDTNDHCTVPQHLKNQLEERYVNAREAFLKTGGDFPFLSRPDEINLHLQLHLRRVGVEGQNDLFKDPSQSDNNGNPSEKSDSTEDSPEPSASSETWPADSFSNQNVGSSEVTEEPPENPSANNSLMLLECPRLLKFQLSGGLWFVLLYMFPSLYDLILMELSKYGLNVLLLSKVFSMNFPTTMSVCTRHYCYAV